MLGRIGVALCLFGVLSGPAGAAEGQVPGSAAQVQLSFAPIVKRVAPAVVNVYATRMIRQSVSPLFSDPFFRQLFGDPFGGGQTSTRRESSLGSGVIINASGLIVTNFHVIAQADEVKVALSDKREFPADIILKDERSDLAVLRIKGAPGDLPTLAFANSDSVQVGDLVLAIGDPFGVGQTVTSGIVSAFARLPGSASQDQYFIQTDAAINPGNSGGALVDMNGDLIGINSTIVSPVGASNGIGFAIPSNLVHAVTAQAATGSVPRRPWLGADLQSVTPDLASTVPGAPSSGVIVVAAKAGGPGAAAGLQTDDVIQSIDGDDIDDLGALNYRLATKVVGGTAKLGILRAGKRYTATIQLQAAPETPPRDTRTLAGDSPLTGLTVLNLSPAVADELSFTGGTTGVIVGDVTDGSNAASAGFAKGDVIVSVNGTMIDSTQRLASVATMSGRTWDITIKRGGRTIRQRLSG
jgi:Do/DeqQ family serine protease